MSSKVTRRVAIVLVMIVIAGTCLIDADAQRRRRRRRAPSRPRITNPAITPPSTDATYASPDSQANAAEPQPRPEQPTNPDDPDSMRRTIRTLSSQVDKLTEKLGQMEESQRSLVDLERLSRAEQRAENLRAQLRDVQAKEIELQAHFEDIDYALQPQNIERYVGSIGTVHPEEAREQRRKQLESEKTRVRAQLDTLGQSRARLEGAIAAADAEVDKIRQRLDAADRAAIENAKKNPGSSGETSPAPQAYPTPTPSPQ